MLPARVAAGLTSRPVPSNGGQFLVCRLQDHTAVRGFKPPSMSPPPPPPAPPPRAPDPLREPQTSASQAPHLLSFSATMTTRQACRLIRPFGESGTRLISSISLSSPSVLLWCLASPPSVV